MKLYAFDESTKRAWAFNATPQWAQKHDNVRNKPWQRREERK